MSATKSDLSTAPSLRCLRSVHAWTPRSATCSQRLVTLLGLTYGQDKFKRHFFLTLLVHQPDSPALFPRANAEQPLRKGARRPNGRSGATRRPFYDKKDHKMKKKGAKTTRPTTRHQKSTKMRAASVLITHACRGHCHGDRCRDIRLQFLEAGCHALGGEA